MTARHHMLLRDLWHLRGQLLAAALVVACGVASFVSMRLTHESLLFARDGYYREYRFADVFVHLKRAPDVMAERLREIPGISEVRSRVVMEVMLDVPGLAEPATGRLVSVPDRRDAMLNDLFLRSGRYIEPGSSDEVIASEAFSVANRLDVGDRVGAVINGQWKSLRIVGIALSPEFIFEVGPGALFPDNRRFGVLWMGHQALASAFDMEGAFNDAVFRLSAGAVIPEVLARIDLALERYGGLAAYGRDDHVSHRFITDEIAQNRISSTWIPGIFLGVATFLLHLVLSRLVSLQRSQIGLLKAFGYGRGLVSLHYLKLAGATVFLGVALGTGAGLFLGEGLTALYLDYYRFPALPLVFSPEVVGAGVGLSIAVAGLGAAGAVARALKLPPAEAIRPERPSSFRPGVLERTRLRLLLPPAGRMILRSIARRGWKSVLSALGIACAVGLLVLGGFFMDTLDYMLRVQFQDVQRDNVTVYFNQPESAAVQHDLRHLPGVLHAEPFRTVPARLRFEHRSRRTEVTGLDAGGDLYQLLDRRLRRVGLPADGLLLSRKLADVLQVGAGDRVTVEVLEGERPVRRLEVAGVVDDLVGIFAYMDRAALNRILREDAAASGARLKIDVRQSEQLYDTLKRMPAVAGTIFREAALDSFKQILDRSLRVSMLINVVFACVIAFGVVYNGARVALSERGNELASLRVLGFTRREVAAILLGEQAVLLLLAIPSGFALGAWVSWLLSTQLDTEMYRVPLVLTESNFAFSSVVVIAAALVSGIIVARRISRLDLVAVLKTRE